MKELKEKILALGKMNEKELEERIKAKVEKFSGMLNEEAALFLIAREIGLEMEKEKKKINEVIEGEKNINLLARVLRVFPLKEFESKGRKGMLKRVELIDETGRINLVLWDEKAKTKITEGKGIELNGVNARKGLKEMELHSNYETEIKESTEEKELKELCIKVFGRKELNKVAEGDRFVVKGKIMNLNKTKLLFNVCPECGKSLEEENLQFYCKQCGQVLKPKKRFVVSFELEDGTGEMKTMVYGSQAERILNESKREIIEKINSMILDELIKELNERVKEKEMSFLAKAKNNSFSGEIELVLEKLF